MLTLFLAFLLAPPENPRLDAMEKLKPWVGSWKGTGWAFNETGQRFDFALTETVQSKVAGTVLLLDGKGLRKNDKGEDITSHDGLVIISYDEKTKRYLWQGHDVGRDAVSTELKITAGAMQWSLPIEKTTTIRFTIKIENNRWHEIGEFSSDGKNWTRFMEVTLVRQ